MIATDTRTQDATKVDARILDYVARAPMTYPVPFDLLPKWPPTRRPTTTAGEKSGRS